MFIFLALLFVSLPVYAESSSPFLIQPDAEYSRRSNISEAKTALKDYVEAMKAHPESVEACWKTSRAAWWVADHASSRSEKLAGFQQGMDTAKAGLALNPDSVEAHFWLGCNYGSYGEVKGVLKSLFLVKPIRHEMAEVNRINDHYDGGGGYRVLGVVDYQVPGFAGGDKKRALEELNKSLAIDPRNPFTFYYLAEYFKTMGDKNQMKAEWKTLKALEVPEDMHPEFEDLLAKGEKRFEK